MAWAVLPPRRAYHRFPHVSLIRTCYPCNDPEAYLKLLDADQRAESIAYRAEVEAENARQRRRLRLRLKEIRRAFSHRRHNSKSAATGPRVRRPRRRVRPAAQIHPSTHAMATRSQGRVRLSSRSEWIRCAIETIRDCWEPTQDSRRA
jgi:hypothetical protein